MDRPGSRPTHRRLRPDRHRRPTPLLVSALAVLLVASLASIGLGSSSAHAVVRPHIAATCSTVAFTTTPGGVNTTIPTSDTCSITSVTGTVASPQYNIAWNHTILGTICANGVNTGCDVSSVSLNFYDFGTSGPFGSFLKAGTGMGCTFAPGDFGGLQYSAYLLGGSTYSCVANIVPDGRAAKFGVLTFDSGPTGSVTTEYIISPGSGPPPPVPSFFATADTTVPGAVDFDASASTASPGATLTSYAWNFGDGSPVVTTTVPTVSHTYAKPGTQSVTLTVTDSTGQTASLTKPLKFPVPAFTYLPNPSNAKAIDFDASTSTGSGGTAVSTYTWNFGDGSKPVSTHSATTTYTYATGGVYTVTLSVTDTSGQTSPLLAKPVTVAAYEVNSVGDAPSTDPTQPVCDTGATVVVNSTTVPECTLRAAIQSVDVAGRGAITFNLPTGVTPTLAPATPLPTLTASKISVDASTVTGGYLKIDGTALDPTTGTGLHVSGANDTIRGLDIENVATGILVDAAGGNDTIAGDIVGLNSNTTKTPVGTGISVTNSSNDLIGGTAATDRDVVDSAQLGIYIGGTSTADRVYGDSLGVGTGGGWAGDGEPVFINNASGNFIGGPSSAPGQAPGNLIDGETVFTQAPGSSVDSGSSAPGSSATGTAGVAIGGYANGANDNTVQGNIIGLQNGGTALPVCSPSDHDFWTEPLVGVWVNGRASGNTIGGTAPGDANVISGAANFQVDADGTLVSGTRVEGNLIGTDITGQFDLPDSCGTPTGVSIRGATTTTVGIAGAGRNVITGQTIGVYVTTTASSFTGPSGPYPGSGATQIAPLSSVVQGNIIGPLADGKTAPGSTQSVGVALAGSGDTVGPNNQISANAVGIQVGGKTSPATKETIVGNQIGTDAIGTTALPNGLGLNVANATGTRVGVPGQKANTISGNLENLVLLQSSVVQNNLIGTTTLGNAAIAPAAKPPSAAVVAGATFAPGGVTPAQVALVTVGPPGGAIGGSTPGSGNVISGSPTADGLDLYGPAVVQGNKIGVGANGTTPVPNAGYGIFSTALVTYIGANPVTGAPAGDGVWPAAPPGGNIVADNKGVGIAVAGGPVLSNLVYDNEAGILHTPSLPGPFIAGLNILGRHGTSVLVGIPLAIPGTIVQIYRAADCGSVPQGQALLQTDTISTTGPLYADIPLQPLGTPLVATLTIPLNNIPGADVTTQFSTHCFGVLPESAVITPTTANPSAAATITASGFTPDELVDATAHSTPVALGQATAGPDGTVHFRFTVPAGLAPGVHVVVLVGRTSGHMTAASFTVTAPPGYRVAGRDGTVSAFGGAGLFGSATSLSLAAPVVGMAATSDGGGYWLAGADGGVFAYGDAGIHGSLAGHPLDAPVVGIIATPDGGGYWLVAADGGVFAYGDAGFHGSMGGKRLTSPVVGITATPDGGGYWLVAADGGVFAFGDARFDGSAGGTHLVAPITGIAADPTGGYWLVGSDGGVFAFDAPFLGSEGGRSLDAPVVSLAATPSGAGYWLVGRDGGVFNFGDATFSGSPVGTAGGPVVGITPSGG